MSILCQHDGGLGSSSSSSCSSGGACGEGSSTVAWTLGYNRTNLLPSASRDMVAQAVRMAAHSDIIVVGLGGYQGGESHDRINIGIVDLGRLNLYCYVNSIDMQGVLMGTNVW